MGREAALPMLGHVAYGTVASDIHMYIRIPVYSTYIYIDIFMNVYDAHISYTQLYTYGLHV